MNNVSSVIERIKTECETKSQQKAIYNSCPYSVSKIVDAMHKPFEAEKVAARLEQRYFNDPTSKYFNMTANQILELWRTKADIGMANGRALDYYIGCKLEPENAEIDIDVYYERLTDVQKNKCLQFKYFYESQLKDKFVYLCRELMLFDSNIGVNGRFDAMFGIGQKLVLIDWKNNESISKENGYEKLYGPLSEYDASDLNKYTIQLYIYKWLLRNKYGLADVPIETLIVRIGEDDYEYCLPIIPYSDELVYNILVFAINEINNKRNDQ